MPLVTGEFHLVSILPSTDPAWAALLAFQSLPPQIVEHQVNGTTFMVFCVDAPTGALAFDGDQVIGLVDSVLAAVSAPQSRLTVTDTGSFSTEWGTDGAGPVWVYSPAAGVLVKYDGAEVAALKAWLP